MASLPDQEKEKDKKNIKEEVNDSVSDEAKDKKKKKEGVNDSVSDEEKDQEKRKESCSDLVSKERKDQEKRKEGITHLQFDEEKDKKNIIVGVNDSACDEEKDQGNRKEGVTDSKSKEGKDKKNIKVVVNDFASDEENDKIDIKKRNSESVSDDEKEQEKCKEGVSDSDSDECKEKDQGNRKEGVTDSKSKEAKDKKNIKVVVNDFASDEENDRIDIKKRNSESVSDDEKEQEKCKEGVSDSDSDEEQEKCKKGVSDSDSDEEKEQERCKEGVNDSDSDEEKDQGKPKEICNDLVSNEDKKNIEEQDNGSVSDEEKDQKKRKEGVSESKLDKEKDSELNEPYVSVTETDDIKMEETLRCKPNRETDKITEESNGSVSDEGKANDINSVVGYHKMTDTAINFNDVKVHCQHEFDRSIGILKVNGVYSRSHGTCFRVGNQRHVMTAYHVVGDAISHMIQEIASRIQYSSKDPELVKKVAKALNVNNADREGKKVLDILKHHLNCSVAEINISYLLTQIQSTVPKDVFNQIKEMLNDKLWKKACTVKFEEEDTTHSFEYDIPFLNEINDVIILKVAGECDLPKPLLLDPSEPPGQVMVFGYPGQDQLKIDIGCPVYSKKEDLEKDINKNVEFWMAQDLKQNRDFFEKGYKDKTENKTILHTSKSFVFGASGGPMTKVDRISNTPFVFMMYQGGIPNFYYEQGHQLYMYKSAPEHVRFEVGISMKKVAYFLESSGKKNLLEEIFENVKYHEN